MANYLMSGSALNRFISRALAVYIGDGQGQIVTAPTIQHHDDPRGDMMQMTLEYTHPVTGYQGKHTFRWCCSDGSMIESVNNQIQLHNTEGELVPIALLTLMEIG